MSSSRTRTQSSSKVTTPLFLPSYSFLAYPPQKERPTQPLPTTPKYTSIEPYTPVRCRNRSSTFTTNITSWISHVEPGTPAPVSPERKGSIASATFVAFPSSSDKENQANTLESLGYASTFVSLRGIARPPSVPEKRKKSFSKDKSSQVDQVPRQKSLKHSRSLSFFRSRTQSTPSPPPPARTPTQLTMPSSKTSSHSRSHSVASTVTKSKATKYPKVRPPPLATDLALAQFVDGGSVEDQIKRYNEAKAKAGGAKRVNGQLVGVGDVYRDEDGTAWRDQEEALEHTHLLKDEAETGWVKFRSHLDATVQEGKSVEASLEDEERRGSVSTQATQDSDLDPRYVMDAETAAQDDLAAFNSARLRSPNMATIAIPSQNCRVARHMRKSEDLLDTFPVPISPRSPLTPRPDLNAGTSNSSHAVRSAPKTRRRPAPLALPPQSPAFVCPTNPISDAEEVRRAFLESSFAPAPRSPLSPVTARTAVPHSARKTMPKQSVLNVNVKGLLKAVGRRK